MLGYDQETSDYTVSGTTLTDITPLQLTVTVPSGDPQIKITGFIPYAFTSAGSNAFTLSIREDTTVLNQMRSNITNNSAEGPLVVIYSGVFSAGSHTFKLSTQHDLSTNIQYKMTSSAPGFILVEIV